MLGWKELLIVLAIVLILFGTKRFKNIGSDLGSAIKGFKKSMADDDVAKSTSDDNAANSESLEKDQQ